jgi:ABC-type sugar transport system permease subunit
MEGRTIVNGTVESSAGNQRWRAGGRGRVAVGQTATAYALLLPMLLFFAVLVYYPIAQALLMSFYRWELFDDVHKFLGLGNYIRLLHDQGFLLSLRNTAVYTFFNVTIGTVLALGLAILLNRNLWGNGIYRFIYVIPYVVPVVASAVVWEWLYHPSQGLINYLLSLVGIGRVGWLVDARYAMSAVIILGIWGHLGFDMIIFLAGLKAIPAVYYDAAKVDGANAWQRLVHVTLPQLRPVILFVIIIGTIRAFEVFGQVYVMTSGGPAEATRVIVYGIYTTAFRSHSMGYASAMSFILFAVLLLLTALQLRLSREPD